MEERRTIFSSFSICLTGQKNGLKSCVIGCLHFWHKTWQCKVFQFMLFLSVLKQKLRQGASIATKNNKSVLTWKFTHQYFTRFQPHAGHSMAIHVVMAFIMSCSCVYFCDDGLTFEGIFAAFDIMNFELKGPVWNSILP